VIIFHGTRRTATAFATKHGLNKDDLIPLYGPPDVAIAALDGGDHTMIVRPPSSHKASPTPRMTPEVDAALYRALLRAGTAAREWDGTPEDLTP
jgi:hypothetical protein